MSLSSAALKARRRYYLGRKRAHAANEREERRVLVKRARERLQSHFNLMVPRPLFAYDGSITIDGVRLYPHSNRDYGIWFTIRGNCPVCGEEVDSIRIRDMEDLGAVLKEFKPSRDHRKEHNPTTPPPEENAEPSCPWNQGYPCVGSHCRMWVRDRQECAFPLIAIGLSGEVVCAVKEVDHA